MSVAPEYCPGVRILIERMASNPEDFDTEDYDMQSMRRKERKFSKIAKMLDDMVVKNKQEHVWKEWHYLTKEERAALIDAYKAMRRGQFDKRIMERVFDDKFYDRQEEALQRELAQEKQMARMLAQQSLSAQVHHQKLVQSANTTGLGIGNPFSGIFK